jgi:8-oxo-dGTP pyrophosphatase MutT (NUDIX family)
MKLHQAVIVREEGELAKRAGMVPFLSDGRALFMVSSDPRDGGLPEIAKGRVEGDEDTKQCAIREGGEELGLRQSNMAASPFLGWSGKMTGSDDPYQFEVYAVLVKDPDAFDESDSEVDKTLWLTPSEFETKGRKSHTQIMNKIFDKIEVYLKK